MALIYTIYIYFKLSLLIITIFNSQFIKAENIDEYKIEMVLFKFSDNTSTELFNISLVEPESGEIINFYDTNYTSTKSKYSKFENISKYVSLLIKNDIDNAEIEHPSIWYRDSDNLEVLQKFKNNIGKSNNLNFLGHHSWIQNIPEYDKSKYLHFNNSDYGFYIKIYKKRFLHLGLKSYIKKNKNSDIQIFIDKEQRIFNEEIYLFDHPEFGILFSINKI